MMDFENICHLSFCISFKSVYTVFFSSTIPIYILQYRTVSVGSLLQYNISWIQIRRIKVFGRLRALAPAPRLKVAF